MSEPVSFHDGRVILHGGDCQDVLAALPENSVDSIVCDPPYHLASIVKRFGGANAAPAVHGTDGLYARASRGFMGKEWDGGDIAFRPETWAAALRVLKPGGHLCAFAATRNSHRMVCAIEDAGFEIRDSIAWLFGTGFPKSHDVSKGIDKAETGVVRGKARKAGKAGYSFGVHYERTPKGDPITAEAREWEGWGTALKPALEPICLARKPLIGTVAQNVLAHGVGGLNIDACKIGAAARIAWFFSPKDNLGRWPANVVHDGSDEVVGAFPETGASSSRPRNNGEYKSIAKGLDRAHVTFGHDDPGGSAARFFYSAKAGPDDRLGSKHPTVKPVDLMRWLVRLVTPKGGIVLDPFAGTGSTGLAALREDCRAILIEREAEYREDIARKINLAFVGEVERASAKPAQSSDDLPLFAGAAE